MDVPTSLDAASHLPHLAIEMLSESNTKPSNHEPSASRRPTPSIKDEHDVSDDEDATILIRRCKPIHASSVHAYNTDDKITLRGSLIHNGRPAELVREKNGKAILIPEDRFSEGAYAGISLAKKAMSEEEEEVDVDATRRSMARRRKTDRPGDVIHACRDCKKEFKRPCDLTKHEKTHSRPWKCTEEMCKYYELGWPTEKERDRHVTDKHSACQPQYRCTFTPCTYASKRESNCKQHMEKAHGWEYVRSKSNGRRKGASDSSGSTTTSIITPATPFIPSNSLFASSFEDFSFATEAPSLSTDGFDFFNADENPYGSPSWDTTAASLEPFEPISDFMLFPLGTPEPVTLNTTDDTDVTPPPTAIEKAQQATITDVSSDGNCPSENIRKPSPTVRGDAKPTTSKESKKRPNSIVDPTGDHEDQDSGPSKKKFKKTSAKRDKRRLMACIFRKYKPNTYNFGNAKFKTCHTTSHEYVSTLIRHLERYHDAILCHNCLAKFASPSDKTQHQSAPCQPANGSQEDKWQSLYKRLCGDGLYHNSTFESETCQTSFPKTQQIESLVPVRDLEEKCSSYKPETTSIETSLTPKLFETPEKLPQTTVQLKPLDLRPHERRELEQLREENNRLLRENNILLRRLLQWESVCGVPELSMSSSNHGISDNQVLKGCDGGMASFSDSGIGTDAVSTSNSSP